MAPTSATPALQPPRAGNAKGLAQQEGLDSRTAREEAQKDNLATEIFSDHPTANVVIQAVDEPAAGFKFNAG